MKRYQIALCGSARKTLARLQPEDAAQQELDGEGKFVYLADEVQPLIAALCRIAAQGAGYQPGWTHWRAIAEEALAAADIDIAGAATEPMTSMATIHSAWRAFLELEAQAPAGSGFADTYNRGLFLDQARFELAETLRRVLGSEVPGV